MTHLNPRIGGFRSGDFESSGQGKNVTYPDQVFKGEIEGIQPAAVVEKLETLAAASGVVDGAVVVSVNRLHIYMWEVFGQLTCRRMSYQSTSSTSSQTAVGLYDSNLNLLFQDYQAPGAPGQFTQTFDPVLIRPGVYYTAVGAFDATFQVAGSAVGTSQVDVPLNQGKPKMAIVTGSPFVTGVGLPNTINPINITASSVGVPYIVLAAE